MKKQNLFGTALFLTWQLVWGFAQSLCGAVVLLHYWNRPHRLFYGAVLTEWDRELSVSLGAFLFVSQNADHRRRSEEGDSDFERLAVHEFGHAVQSLVLGPLYLPVIGLPSALWANLSYFEQKRRRKNISYYSFWPERMANALGTRITGRNNPSGPGRAIK